MRPSLQILPGMMPAFALPGEMTPGQFGPISRVAGRAFRNVIARIMSSVGMPSVMQTTSAMPASAASITASAANGGGTKMTEALAPVFLHRVAHGVEDRPAFVRRAALARRDPADDVGAVGRGLLGVKRPLAAGEALDDQAGRLVDQYGHSVSNDATKARNHEESQNQMSSWSSCLRDFVVHLSACEFNDLLRGFAHRVRGREVHPALLAAAACLPRRWCLPCGSRSAPARRAPSPRR